MKIRKPVLLMAIGLLSALLLAGCGEGQAGGKEQTYEIQISYENNPEEPLHKAVEKWKELAEEQSDGQLQLELFPSAQLGSKGDVIEQAMSGSNVIQIADASFMMDYVPDMGILSAPYLTSNFDEQIYLTTTDWYKSLEEDLQEQGLHIISGSWPYGTRHLMANKEISTPDDLNGLQIRVPDNKLFIKTFEAMGATPTPLPLEDLYTSLQQGLVDGAENPLPVLEGAKMQEVVNDLSLTGHMNMTLQWVAGQQYIESLPDDIVTILKETAEEAGKTMGELVEQKDKEIIEKYEDAGIEITEVDTEEFRKATETVYEEFPEWSPGLYDEVQELLEDM